MAAAWLQAVSPAAPFHPEVHKDNARLDCDHKQPSSGLKERALECL